MGAINATAKIVSLLVGRRLIRTERGEHGWVFCSADELLLHVACPWRTLVRGRIAFGNCDHGQTFGLPDSSRPVIWSRPRKTVPDGFLRSLGWMLRRLGGSPEVSSRRSGPGAQS